MNCRPLFCATTSIKEFFPFVVSFVFSKVVLPPHGQLGLHNILLQPSSTWWRGRAPGGSRAGLEKMFFTWFRFTQFKSFAHVLMPVFHVWNEHSWSIFSEQKLFLGGVKIDGLANIGLINGPEADLCTLQPPLTPSIYMHLVHNLLDAPLLPFNRCTPWLCS